MARLALLLSSFSAFLLLIQTSGLSLRPPPLNVKPRSIYGRKPDLENFTNEEWLFITKSQMESTKEEYPGYKKGNTSMSDVCGMPSSLTRITGGEEARPHSYPWMAALFLSVGPDRYFCGGTLISNDWVMTAAHCVDGADSVTVYLGAHNVREEAEDGRIELESHNFFAHPKWNTFLIRNDIALIQLPKSIEFNDIIRPICLPTRADEENSFSGLDALATGWGKPNDAADGISPVLRQVMTHTIANWFCALELATINHNNICISGKGGNSTCNGDSGGPLEIVTDDGRYKQIGITSFGLSFGCELGLHAAFTRITSYLDFIETETGIIID